MLWFVATNEIIDGGNTHFPDTIRREKYCAEQGIHFVGAGVSGGEEGALKGPSIMPGGNKASYKLVKPYLEAISAKDKNNLPFSYNIEFVCLALPRFGLCLYSLWSYVSVCVGIFWLYQFEYLKQGYGYAS